MVIDVAGVPPVGAGVIVELGVPVGELVLEFETLAVGVVSELRLLPEPLPVGGVMVGGLVLLPLPVGPPKLVPTEVVLVWVVSTVTEVLPVETTVWPGSVAGGVVAGAVSAKAAPTPSAINKVVNPN